MLLLVHTIGALFVMFPPPPQQQQQQQQQQQRQQQQEGIFWVGLFGYILVNH